MQNVALLGFGTVGASVARILDERVSDVNLTLRQPMNTSKLR